MFPRRGESSGFRLTLAYAGSPVSPRTPDELDSLLARLPLGGAVPFRLEEDRSGRTFIKPDESVIQALRALPALVADVRRLRDQVADLEANALRQESKPRAPVREALPAESLDDLGSLLSAPFRISTRAASAAKTDPLAALAVQVARATADGASEKEKARLIAMAFAAAEGDLDAFWEARQSRKSPRA